MSFDWKREIVFTALAGALLFAISSAHAGETPTGKVRGIYREASRGVLVEQLSGNAQGAALWADVDFGAASSQPRRRAMVRLPAGLEVEKGDLVEVRLALPPVRTGMLAPMPEVSRATLVAAKWFTPRAEAFDAAPQRLLSVLR
jgi:hypothetical protein